MPPWILALMLALAPEAAPERDTPPPTEPAADADDSNAAADAARDARLDALERDNAELAARLERQAAAHETAREDDRKRLDELEQDNAELSTRLDEQAQARDKAEAAERRRVRAELHGYLDVGLFRVAGDGSGLRPDIGHLRFPEYDGRVADAWVFMGDPLSVAINSRGDPADLGSSRAILFNPVGAGGNPTLIVNAVNLAPEVALGDQITVDALVDFLPRVRNVATEDTPFLGDYVDIKRAQLRWLVPVRRFDLTLALGKIDSVFGWEYRYQEAPDRITVTPSLVCRYTCGRPVGLSARFDLLQRRLRVNASVTNGSNVVEQFGFSNEIDANAFKTITTRVAYEIPVGTGLEIGGSGQVGAQDLQPRNDRLHWQYGFDLHFGIRGFELAAEYVEVHTQGRSEPNAARCGLAPCLRARGVYGLLGYRVTNWVMPYFRTDWRDALHEAGTSYVYISKVIRWTPGLRFDVAKHVAIKAEYTFNHELGRLPQFNDDIVTSSVVASF